MIIKVISQTNYENNIHSQFLTAYNETFVYNIVKSFIRLFVFFTI